MIALSNNLFSVVKLLLPIIWKIKKREEKTTEVSSCDDSFNFDKLFAKTQTDRHIHTTGNYWHRTPRDQMLAGCAGGGASVRREVKEGRLCAGWGGQEGTGRVRRGLPLLLTCTANNSRITVGKHNWDLRQKQRTDGEDYYTLTHRHIK